jgi:Pregnancy-associated plasma protein-A
VLNNNESNHFVDHQGIRKLAMRQHSSSSINSVGDAYYNSVGRTCGTRNQTSIELKRARQLVKIWERNKKLIIGRSSNSSSNVQDIIKVPTYFHLIMNKTHGNISDDILLQQLNVLNDAYAPDINFVLMGITRTVKSSWYGKICPSTQNDDMVMKKALHQGDASTLNVYIIRMGCPLLGYSSFPPDYHFGIPYKDGVVIEAESIPGGLITNYNEGDTLVHEVGHWFGLQHTFSLGRIWTYVLPNFLQTGCFSGDMISDTADERIPSIGCPEGRDTCWFRWGKDPIHNYMDYSDDICATTFTRGQRKQMRATWDVYRRNGSNPSSCRIHRRFQSCRRNGCFWFFGICYYL